MAISIVAAFAFVLFGIGPKVEREVIAQTTATPVPAAFDQKAALAKLKDQIKGHETSMHAATLAELAASKNLFWDYFDNVYKKENTERVKSVDGLKALAVESGLKITRMKKGQPSHLVCQ